MFKKRFLRALEMCSIVLVSLTFSSLAMMSSPMHRVEAGSVYQQHLTSTGLAQISDTYRLDCFRRTYNFSNNESASMNQKDASNYYLNLS